MTYKIYVLNMASSKNFSPKCNKLGFFFPKTSFGQFATSFFVAKWQNFITKKNLVVGPILSVNIYFHWLQMVHTNICFG